MRNNVIFNNGKNTTITPDETQKATSLLSLRKALINEEYEDCANLIQTAKGFGAQQCEIDEVIVTTISGNEISRQNEAREQSGSRPRF